MARFSDYRRNLLSRLAKLGYYADWKVLHACSFGVPQLRPRFVLVALRERFAPAFVWPEPNGDSSTVGDSIGDLMASRGWRGASQWRRRAKAIAPTVVGGSKKHGGPDLGPTRARRQWAILGVDGLGIADAAPGPEFPLDKKPRLTVRMVARIQGISDSWVISGGKTAAYRQVGNAFPPPVARAIGEAIKDALNLRTKCVRHSQSRLFELARQ
jgi:DNA (cytosine-5)-methyltransferase 1